MTISNFIAGEVLDVQRLNNLVSQIEANTAPDVMSKVSDKVGTVRQSVLDQTEFNNENPGIWLLMNGQGCNGSEYQTLTGNTSVPNLTTEGAFLRQAKPGRAQGSFEDMDWKGFYQMNTGQNTSSYSHNSEYHGKSTTSFIGRTFAGGWNAPSAATGSMWDTSEIRPKNVAVNHFMKIDY